MINGDNSKNKIVLSEYSFQDDINTRCLLSTLNLEEIEVLQELVLGPLEVSIEALAEDLETSSEAIERVVLRLAPLELFQKEGGDLTIHKAKRRILEVELARFDDDFKADYSYVKALFHRIPLDVFSKWYPFPKTTSDLYRSLFERIFFTPKDFERYLQEITFTEDAFGKVLSLLYSEETKPLCLTEVQSICGLDETTLHELVLHLELNLLAFLGVERSGEAWKYVLLPPYEWSLWQEQNEASFPSWLPEESIAKKEKMCFSEEVASMLLFVDQVQNGVKSSASYEQLQLIPKLTEFELLQTTGQEVRLSVLGQEFLAASKLSRKRYLLKHPRLSVDAKGLMTSQALRQIEQKLLLLKGWVDLDRFISGLHVPLKTHPSVELTFVGRRTYYSVPTYTPEEHSSLKTFLLERFVSLGLLQLGTYSAGEAICLTEEGRDYLA